MDRQETERSPSIAAFTKGCPTLPRFFVLPRSDVNIAMPSGAPNIGIVGGMVVVAIAGEFFEQFFHLHKTQFRCAD